MYNKMLCVIGSYLKTKLHPTLTHYMFLTVTLTDQKHFVLDNVEEYYSPVQLKLDMYFWI